MTSPRLTIRLDPTTGWLDELIAHGPALVHSEEMSHRCHVVVYTWADGAEVRVAYFRGGSSGKCRARVTDVDGIPDAEVCCTRGEKAAHWWRDAR